MQKRELGKSGLEIAPLVLGGNVFGWTTDKATSVAQLKELAPAASLKLTVEDLKTLNV